MPKGIQVPDRLPETKVFTFGQVLVESLADEAFRLMHRDDAEVAETLQVFGAAEDALEIVRADDDGNYRPLKTAPDLRHGWRLELSNRDELHRALEFLYPGRLAVLAASRENRLITTPL